MKMQKGRLAERLGSGLQNRVQQFKSATDHRKSATYKVADFVYGVFLTKIV